MKKLLMLATLVAGTLIFTTTSVVKADHFSSCGPGWGSNYGGGYYGGGYYGGGNYGGGNYSYSPPVRYFNYGPVFDYGYAYPTSGVYFNRPGLSISIGSGYRGYGRGGFGYGGYTRHHHH